MFNLVYFQLLQAIRIPLTFFWTIGLPTILHLTFSYSELEANYLVGYIIMSTFLYGASLQLVAQRESGFLKTVLQSKLALIRHIVSIFLANTIIILISCTIYLLFVHGFSNLKSTGKLIIHVLALSPIAFLISQIILLLRIKISDSSTLVSIVLLVMTIMCFTQTRVSVLGFNIINPIYLIGHLVNNQSLSELGFTHIALIIGLALVGLYSSIKLSLQAVEGR